MFLPNGRSISIDCLVWLRNVIGSESVESWLLTPQWDATYDPNYVTAIWFYRLEDKVAFKLRFDIK